MAKLTIKRPKQTFQGYREYIDRIPLEMVLIPDGTFTMGAPESEEGSRDNERPQHDVTISSFLMGRYAVTQAQWQAIASRSDLKVNQDLYPDPSFFKQPYQGIDRWQRPVEKVNWYDAVEFCNRLSKLTGRDYRLPSEAQWEYACRGVTEPLNLEAGASYPPFHFGETITTDLANYRGTDDKDSEWSGSYGREPKGEYRQETTLVGYFEVVNFFGLSDMHGNVWEWCADDWHSNYEGAPNDGSAWIDGNEAENVNSENQSYLANNQDKSSYSVLRGGSWVNDPDYCRSAIRNLYVRRDYRYKEFGFRVVCAGMKSEV
ncbi:MAG: formylglycine-generating enzyme family protein [Moorea sp. SIO3E2]|nr:formylglycine-generating enzyme family protein [Moorena sp. SIO3E2]